VIHTLLEAIILVALVVIVFLQTWRASVIPLLAVPVSVVGTFAVMLGFGFDQHAVAVRPGAGHRYRGRRRDRGGGERRAQHRDGLSPREATIQAMKEVSGPIIAIALVLCAVFVPIAFMSGLSGQFYKQFALTIAISTVISAFSSLTLSPALAAALLKPANAPKDALTRAMDKVFGGFFAWFNRFFNRASHSYETGVTGVLKRKARR
jgi:multidrug efflux pump